MEGGPNGAPGHLVDRNASGHGPAAVATQHQAMEEVFAQGMAVKRKLV